MAKTTRLLVLPGIGDVYWVAVALEGLKRRHGWGDLEVSVWDFDGRRRSAEFVERIPFVRSGGYYAKPPHPHKLPAFRRSYLTGEQSLVRGLFGFDAYVAVNGALRNGWTVEATYGVPCNWYLDLLTTPNELAARDHARHAWGDYVFCHFSDFGMFREWVRAWNVDAVAGLLARLHAETGLTYVLTGCEWDQPFARAVKSRAGAGVVDATGVTDADRFYGVLRGARAVLGWCGGNTILATALRIPTLMLWSRFFPDPRFYRNACPPDACGERYVPMIVEAHTPAVVARRFVRLLNTYPEGAL